MSERLAEACSQGDRQPGPADLHQRKESGVPLAPVMQMPGTGPGHLAVSGSVRRQTFFVAPPSTRIFDPVM